MILYHRTDAAQAIIRDGFRDGEGSYMLEDFTLRGVFLSDMPLDCNDIGKCSEQLLEITLPNSLDISDDELVEDGKTYREWCVPADIINRFGTIRFLEATL